MSDGDDTGAPSGPATAEWTPFDELPDLDDLDGHQGVIGAVPEVSDAGAEPEVDDGGAEPAPVDAAAAPEPAQPRSVGATAASVSVPGQYHFLSWWKLALMLLAVWIPAAAAGLGLFSWWCSLADKTPAVFVVLVYTVATMVAGMIAAMVVDKPLVSAVALGLVSAVFISAVAAAPLYGQHYCQHAQRCVAGILPY